GRWRLGDEDVEGTASDLAALEPAEHRRLVVDPAPGAVHEEHTLLELRHHLVVHEPLGFRGEWRVHGDDVRLTPYRLEADELDPELGGAIVGEHRIESDDPHLQAAPAVGDDAADGAEADDRQGFPGELAPREL